MKESDFNLVEYLNLMEKRRTIRSFSSKEVPIDLINNALKCANSAPSGANMQPWHFTVIRNQEVKKTLRAEAEKIEDEFYHKRAPEEWLKALEPFGTDEFKPYLETASTLIIIFNRNHILKDGEKIKTYYPIESTGIATGFLISALHLAGVSTLLIHLNQ